MLGFFAATGMDEHVDLGTRVEAGKFTGKVLAACKKEPRQALAIAAIVTWRTFFMLKR